MTEFRNEAGVGVRGLVEGRLVEVGRGAGGVEVRIDGIAVARLEVRDTVKELRGTLTCPL